MTPGTCLYCGCTEDHACEGSCAWVTDAKDICTACFGVLDFVRELVPILGIVAANPKSSIQLAAAKFDVLQPESQQALVMTCRAVVDGMRDALLESLSSDAIGMQAELLAIENFLQERCPEELAGEKAETFSDIVIRLLEPHVGSRIVLPGARR